MTTSLNTSDDYNNCHSEGQSYSIEEQGYSMSFEEVMNMPINQISQNHSQEIVENALKIIRQAQEELEYIKSVLKFLKTGNLDDLTSKDVEKFTNAILELHKEGIIPCDGQVYESLLETQSQLAGLDSPVDEIVSDIER